MTARIFILRPNDPPDDEGKRPLQLVVTRGRGRRIRVPVGASVEPDKWLQKEQRVRKGVPGGVSLNGSLDRLRADAIALALDHPGDEDLKKALLDRVGRSAKAPEPTIRECFTQFLADKSLEVKAGTMAVYEALEKHVHGYVNERMKPSDIGASFAKDFQQHLVRLGMENSTSNKYLTRFRGFLRWMEEAELIEKAPKARTLATVDNDVVRLDLKELAALRDLDLGNARPGYEAARDLFLFSAYTGLRYGDLQALTWDRVGDDAVFVRESKTGAFRRIPITPAARGILDKHEGHKTPLPRLSNQKANDYIKVVAEMAGITSKVMTRSRKGGTMDAETLPKNKVIGMHAGRRTFVSLMLESGVSTKELLGVTHSDLRALQRYAAASEDHLRKNMEATFGEVAQ